ncbi:hypothetical protein H0H87_002738 [Tephrocybe sp. NHM501043]|nr:hypothetical protein H0H87_002738 [Tephrocybe sp. NHM501043]
MGTRPGILKHIPHLVSHLQLHIPVILGFVEGGHEIFSHKSLTEPLSVGRLWRFESSEVVEEVLSLANEHNLDLWQVAHSHVDIYTPGPSTILPSPLLKLPHTLVSNVSAPLARPERSNSYAEWDLPSLQNSSFHNDYHPLFEIDEFVRELPRVNPDLVTVKPLGHSGMGKEMISLIISKDGNEGALQRNKHKPYEGVEKLAFVIIGAQHAREWIATATSLYLAHALVSNSSEPRSLSHLLDHFNFHIVPVPNPDGYEYTWESDRFWYKTRQKMSTKSTCLGLDMNRNWGYKWKPRPEEVSEIKKHDGPVDPCSHWYPGQRPFEAPETNNIANMVTAIPNLVGFLDLRSYGQMLWLYTTVSMDPPGWRGDE